MRSYSLIAVWLITFITACHPSQPADTGRSLADSALKVHFERVRKLRHYDTAGFEHKLLTAVYQRDSAYLTQYLHESWEEWQDKSVQLISDSSLNLTPLADMGADEAYRFRSEFGYPISVNGAPLTNMRTITITRNGGVVRLDVLTGYYEVVGDISAWTFRSTTHRRIDTVLSMKVWDKLQAGLRYCDFWGLKPSNENYDYVDVGMMSIEGYIRPVEDWQKQQYHRICRQNVPGTALDSAWSAINVFDEHWPPYY